MGVVDFAIDEAYLGTALCLLVFLGSSVVRAFSPTFTKRIRRIFARMWASIAKHQRQGTQHTAMVDATYRTLVAACSCTTKTCQKFGSFFAIRSRARQQIEKSPRQGTCISSGYLPMCSASQTASNSAHSTCQTAGTHEQKPRFWIYTTAESHMTRPLW